MLYPASIKSPNIAVPAAVANTINPPVKAFMLPIYFTPYISAQVDDPNTLAKPFVIPINPKNIKEEKELLNEKRTNAEINNGIFI